MALGNSLNCFPRTGALLAGEFSSSLRLTWSIDDDVAFKRSTFDARPPRLTFAPTSAAMTDVFRRRSVSSTTWKNDDVASVPDSILA